MVPFGILLVIVVASIGLSYLFVPSNEQFRARLFKDRLGGDISELINAGVFGDKASAHAQFQRMSVEQLTFISQISRLTPRERLRHIFNPVKHIEYDVFIHHFVITAVQYVDVIGPDEAFALLAPKSARIPAPFRLQLLRLLARNALATSKPEVAVRILREACTTDDADWQTISSLVDTERWNQRPEEARAALKSWLEKHSKKLDPQLYDTANEMLFTLALEANVPGEALDSCLRDLAQLGSNETIPEPLMEQAFRAAEYAGKTREILPWIERYLSSFSEDRIAWPDLLKQTQSQAASDPAYLLWTQRAAQVADWNNVTDRALHHHLRLIALNVISSLDRYLSLSAYLGRNEEAARLLSALGPVKDREDLQLTLARLKASNGEPQAAFKLYTEWIARHPDDHDARWEHACLHEALTLSSDSIKTFTHLLTDYPDDVRAAQRAVSLMNSHGQHHESLQRLDALDEASFNADMIEDYTLLAESLDQPQSLMRALRIKIGCSHPPLASDYLRLAEIARSSESTDASVKILAEAIEKLPSAPALRSQIAAMLLREERYDEAVTAAMHPAAWVDNDARLTALSASLHTTRAGDVLQALGDGFASGQLAYNTMLDLAVAYRQIGQPQRSAELFAAVPETPTRCHRIAEARMLAGDFEEAARIAQQNLKNKTMPDASDWVLLGDIRHKQGLIAEAQAAYARAIDAVTSRTQRRTAAVDSPAGINPQSPLPQ